MTPAEFTELRRQTHPGPEHKSKIDLAEQLGVTPRSVYRYEVGERPIPQPIATLLTLLATSPRSP